MTPSDNQTAFELQPAELAVPLKAVHGGRSYNLVHKLRAPSHEDWFAYEAALCLSVEEFPGEESGAEPRYRFDARNSEAAQLLWDRLVLSVEGYALPLASVKRRGEEARSDSSPGVADKSHETAAHLQISIPLAHKEAAVRSLTLVAPAESERTETDEPFPLAAERIPIFLEAARAGRAYPRLAHWFRPPELDQERCYRRLMAETFMVGGSRTARALIPPRLPALSRLYDALILSVEQYSLNGLAELSAQQLARCMDAWHKRAAVQALFGDAAGDDPVSDVGGEKAGEGMA